MPNSILVGPQALRDLSALLAAGEKLSLVQIAAILAENADAWSAQIAANFNQTVRLQQLEEKVAGLHAHRKEQDSLLAKGYNQLTETENTLERVVQLLERWRASGDYDEVCADELAQALKPEEL